MCGVAGRIVRHRAPDQAQGRMGCRMLRPEIQRPAVFAIGFHFLRGIIIEDG